MSRWAAILVVALLSGGCGTPGVRIESKALGGVPAESSDEFIIAAVDNDPSGFLTPAGGTPRGYDNIVPYGATSTARARIRALEKDYGLREVSEWPIEPLHMDCAVLKIPEGADRASLLAGMSADPRVKLAEPLQTYSTRGGYNDPYLELQRGFRQMDVIDAHSLSSGQGVKVAIIDTGADTQHQDLRGRIAAADNFVDSDTEQFRRDRHGTEMAGVIAAVANNHEGIVGVAPDARLLLFKACWQLHLEADAASCNSFTLARALVAAMDARVQVVNLSLVGPDDPLLRGLIEAGMRRGIVFVGAASDAADGRRGLSQLPGIIEVASTERSSPSDAAVYAPGKEILTLMPGGHYDFASGDSIATAEVTGVVALLLAENRNLTASAASKLLRDTSTRAKGSASANGAAHVDACAAVVALLGRGTCARDDRADAPMDRADRVPLH
jgi:subtilisin family serine protease